MKIRNIPIVAATVFISVAGLIAESEDQDQNQDRDREHEREDGDGTSILHLFIRKAMSHEGDNTNATGVVHVRQNRQGRADNQTFDLTVARLGTNASYDLFALLDDNTNFTFVTDLTTDGRGRTALHYSKVGSSRGQGTCRGKTPLPAVLDPVSNIRELAIANACTQQVLVSTQVVLRADLTAPDCLEYLVKRKLTNDGTEPQAEGALRIHASTRFTQFRLRAEDLNSGTNYFFVINGGIVSTNASDSKGRINIKALPAGVPDILDIHHLAIWNSASNGVLSTTLP